MTTSIVIDGDGGVDGCNNHMMQVPSSDTQEREVERLLSHRLVQGFLLLETACPACATPLVKEASSDTESLDNSKRASRSHRPDAPATLLTEHLQQQQQAQNRKTPAILHLPMDGSNLSDQSSLEDNTTVNGGGSVIEPLPGVPFCVWCKAHVVTDEHDVERLTHATDQLTVKGTIMVAMTGVSPSEDDEEVEGEKQEDEYPGNDNGDPQSFEEAPPQRMVKSSENKGAGTERKVVLQSQLWHAPSPLQPEGNTTTAVLADSSGTGERVIQLQGAKVVQRIPMQPPAIQTSQVISSRGESGTGSSSSANGSKPDGGGSYFKGIGIKGSMQADDPPATTHSRRPAFESFSSTGSSPDSQDATTGSAASSTARAAIRAQEEPTPMHSNQMTSKPPALLDMVSQEEEHDEDDHAAIVSADTAGSHVYSNQYHDQQKEQESRGGGHSLAGSWGLSCGATGAGSSQHMVSAMTKESVEGNKSLTTQNGGMPTVKSRQTMLSEERLNSIRQAMAAAKKRQEQEDRENENDAIEVQTTRSREQQEESAMQQIESLLSGASQHSGLEEIEVVHVDDEMECMDIEQRVLDNNSTGTATAERLIIDESDDDDISTSRSNIEPKSATLNRSRSLLSSSGPSSAMSDSLSQTAHSQSGQSQPQCHDEQQQQSPLDEEKKEEETEDQVQSISRTREEQENHDVTDVTDIGVIGSNNSSMRLVIDNDGDDLSQKLRAVAPTLSQPAMTEDGEGTSHKKTAVSNVMASPSSSGSRKSVALKMYESQGAEVVNVKTSTEDELESYEQQMQAQSMLSKDWEQLNMSFTDAASVHSKMMMIKRNPSEDVVMASSPYAEAAAAINAAQQQQEQKKREPLEPHLHNPVSSTSDDHLLSSHGDISTIAKDSREVEAVNSGRSYDCDDEKSAQPHMMAEEIEVMHEESAERSHDKGRAIGDESTTDTTLEAMTYEET